MTEMAAMTPAADVPRQETRPARGRLFYLDNLRVVLTVLVVLHHLGVTYGHIPVWYYHENPPAGDSMSGLLDVFVAVNQMFFMGFFFLISGYFVPASYDRKGGKTFLKDRAIRLGIPLLAFLLVLRPLTNFGSYEMAREQFGASYFMFYLVSWDPGPLWFVETLLVFVLAYALIRRVRRNRTALAPAETLEARSPGAGAIIGYTAALALATFAWRIIVPIPFYVPVLGLPTAAYLPQYVSMFVLGVLAYRLGWFAKLPVKAGWLGLVAAIVSLVLVVPAFMMGKPVEGGLTWQSAYLSTGQAVFCVGIVLALLVLFRQRFNVQRKLGAFLAPQAYAVYVIHATVLVVIGYALSGLAIPPLAKFGVAALLALPLCWSVAWLIRRIPGIQRVL